MAEKFFQAEAEIKVQDTKFKSALAGARSSMIRFAGETKLLLGGLAIGGGVGAFGLLKLSSEAEEVRSKFSAVFGDMTKDQMAWSNGYAAAVGRSKTETQRMLSSFQDLLVPMGLTSTDAAGVSQNLTKLANDLASFNEGVSAKDAMNDLQAALTGSGEVMKKYGVVLNETTLKQKASQLGLDPKNLSETQKALIRYTQIVEGTGAAHGDLVRTGDSLRNSSITLWSTLQDVGITLGDQLAPAAKIVIAGLQELIAQIGIGENSFGSFSQTAASWASYIMEWIQQIVFTWQNWDLTAQTTGITIMQWLSAIGNNAKTLFDNLVVGVQWAADNWQDLFVTAFDYTMTAMINFGENVRKIMGEIWDYIASGGKDGINWDMTPLLEGARSSIKNMPEWKDFLGADPEYQKQLDEVQNEWNRRWDQMKEKTKQTNMEAVKDATKIASLADLNVNTDQYANKDGGKKKNDKLAEVGSIGSTFSRIQDLTFKKANDLAKQQLAAQKQVADNTKKIAENTSKQPVATFAP